MLTGQVMPEKRQNTGIAASIVTGNI